MNREYDALNCLCTRGGIRQEKEHFGWGPGMRNSYSLHYIISGCGQLILNGVSYNVSAGQSFLVFPFSNVEIRSDTKTPWSYAWIEFKGLESAWLVGKTTFTKDSPIVNKLPIDNQLELFDIICKDNEMKKSYMHCRMNSKLFLLLSYYIQYYPKQSEIGNNYVNLAKSYIEDNFRKGECTVKNVAEYIKVDRTYLFRLFKKETGVSVLSYINNCRITKACVMLLDKNISVKDVAYSVGYSDQMYFSKVFKKIKHLTPTEYRNIHSE